MGAETCPVMPIPVSPPYLQLTKDGDLSLKSVRDFVLDECDKMLEQLGTLGGHLCMRSMANNHPLCV